MQLRLELCQFTVAFLHDRRHIGQGSSVGGHLAQLLRALFDLQLFPDLPANRLLDLFQAVRQGTLRQIVRESILVTQLVQHGMFDVVALLGINQ